MNWMSAAGVLPVSVATLVSRRTMPMMNPPKSPQVPEAGVIFLENIPG
jgi:hypothetical protein